jgi:hypothetical protein
MMKLINNYKTSAPAILILVSIALYWGKLIDKEQFDTGVSLMTVMGLLGAKDWNRDEKGN